MNEGQPTGFHRHMNEGRKKFTEDTERFVRYKTKIKEESERVTPFPDWLREKRPFCIPSSLIYEKLIKDLQSVLLGQH